MPAATESAIANGDTRTLDLYNQHTKESIYATYRVDGRYDPAVLEKLNWFLRDWRRNEAIHMDPRLFDAVWETYREAGATAPIVVVCGYRSPRTNAMLRRRSHMVAQHSQHMLGKAMDTEMPGMSMERVREIAMRLEMGGVGFYGDSSFIHIDVGGVRYWPRMTYAQLARVFPDGKTVLLPKDGKPMPGYEEARAELAARGSVAPPLAVAKKGKGLFAWLFGLGKSADESEEDAEQLDMQGKDAQTKTAQSEVPLATTRAVAETRGSSAIDDAGRGMPETALQTLAANIPMPPHRPTDFLALAEAPLPPNRPTEPLMTASLRTNTDIDSGSRDDIVPAHAQAEPNVKLPTIITDGDNGRALARGTAAIRPQSHVLAYAPVAQMPGLRMAARDVAHGETTAAQGKDDAPSGQPAPQIAEMAKLQHALMLAPTLTGLRRAARIETAQLSQRLAAGYLGHFGSAATNLPTDRFVGPAVVGLRAAERSRMVLVDGSIAMRRAE